MTCFINNRIEDISEDVFLQGDEVVFTCYCDDGRVVLISGQYCERYQLPEILYQIGNQLCNAPLVLTNENL